MKTKTKFLIGLLSLLAILSVGAMTQQELLDAINASGVSPADLTTTLRTSVYASAIGDIDVQIANIQAKIREQNQPLIDQIQALQVKRAALIAAQAK